MRLMQSRTTGFGPVPVAAALMAGLYIARVACESQAQATGAPLSIACLLGGLTLAAVAVCLLHCGRWEVWPFLLLGVYALWPQANSPLALATAVVSLSSLLLAQRRVFPLPACLGDLGVGLGALLLYGATLAPSVQPADAGEFQLVASVLGIAHPPGYPLYTLLGKIFTLIPLGDMAWRVNLFAAVCAAATLAVVSYSVRRATGSQAGGLLAALMLGLAPTYWAQGTFANIRSLTGLLVALAIASLLRYGEGREGRYLAAFAVSLGLGVTHHTSLIPLALPFGAYLLAVDPRLAVQPRRWLKPLAGFGGTLLILLYLPLRSAMNPPFGAGAIRTFDSFLAYVLALGFRGDFLYFIHQPTLGLRLGILADILRLEFGLPLTLAAMALGLWTARRRWPWTLLWAGVAVVNSLAAMTYRAPQTVEYLLPTYVALAVGLGLGLGTILAGWDRSARRVVGTAGWMGRAVLGGLVAWWGLSNGLAAYPSYRALHRDDSARRQAVQLLEAAPQGALVLSNWHQATPLWYLQQVEGLRRDVAVVYVYPEGATPNGQVWLRRIQEGVGQRPVIVTNNFSEFAGLPYRLTPLAEAWLVQTKPPQEAQGEFAGQAQTLGEKIEFLGARLVQTEVTAGQTVEVQVAWRPQTALERDYSWFVHLVGPEGIVGQADITYSAGRVAAGERVVDTHRFALRPNVRPGEYQLVGGVYITFPDGHWERLRTFAGQEAIPLGTVRVRPRPTMPATAHPLAVSWGDGSRLVGVDYDDSVAGQRRVYLHWYRRPGAADLDLSLLQRGQMLGQVRVSGGRDAGYQTVACDISSQGGRLDLQATIAGHLVPVLGPWHWPIPRGVLRLPEAPPGVRYLDLGGEIVLAGARWQGPVAEVPLLAELHFLANKPLDRDYTVSLSLEGNGWRVQHDGTPALGAIPTLKWLAGWQVRDLRLLAVPKEATGSARLSLTVYDAFTLAPLSIGDDRLAKAGQGTRVVLWEGQVR